jgi:hypothetical protein
MLVGLSIVLWVVCCASENFCPGESDEGCPDISSLVSRVDEG